METHHIKHQHQETANHLEHSFPNCYWLHTRQNTQQLHDETKVLLMDTHLILHATQLKQLTQTKTHSLNALNTYSDCPRNHESHNLS